MKHTLYIKRIVAITGGQGLYPQAPFMQFLFSWQEQVSVPQSEGKRGNAQSEVEAVMCQLNVELLTLLTPRVARSEIEDLKRSLHHMNRVPDGYPALGKEETQVGFV